jgi:hypothetical protein
VFDPDSRYAALPTATLTQPDGRKIAYVTRRLLPSPSSVATHARVPVREGTRLDLIAAQHVGDPLHYWAVCDANETMDPQDLTAIPGETVRVGTPKY